MKEFVLQGTPGKRNFKIDYKSELNEEQLPIVTEGDGPTLVLAGAGSGKTRTITYRVAYLLEQGVSPANILLLTFTNKSSKEMISRVENLLGVYPSGLWAGTFHSIANRLLRKYAEWVGYASNFSILDMEDGRDLVSLCIKDLKIETKNKRFPNARVLQSLFSFQRNKGVDLESALEIKHPKFLPIIDEIRNVSLLYAKMKLEQNAMDFDDLLLKLLELLKTNSDIAQNLARQFEYILVDEFQDTNVIQAEIVRLLGSVHKNILVVGDDAQSIYSFRAVEIKNILGFPSEYEGSQTFKLTTNYRSTPQILDVANAVILNNEDQFKKELIAVVKPGDLPYVVPASSSGQEAQYITEQIFELHAEGTDYREIAVLFRAAYHSQALEFELMKRNIPYDYRGGMKFFERSHIKDIVAHLRIVHNVKDGMAWVRALRIHPGIGLVTAQKIARAAGELSSAKEAIAFKPPGGKKAQAGFESMARVLNSIFSARDFVSDYIRALATNAEYQAYLENEFPNYKERLEDIEQFAIFAEQYDNLSDFLEAVSLTDEFGVKADRYESTNEDKLVLSTIHQAKGLEWDAVFVINLTEGSFPNSKAYEEGGVEEERRLFYVATTRARKKLFLTYTLTAGYEHVEIKQPSIFLDEIPKEQTELIQLRRAHAYGSAYSSGVSRDYEPSKTVFKDLYEEPTIVRDALGEVIEKTKKIPSSFLSDVGGWEDLDI